MESAWLPVSWRGLERDVLFWLAFFSGGCRPILRVLRWLLLAWLALAWPPPVEADARPEDDFLLFEVVLGRATLSEGVGGYRRPGGVVLALGELAAALEFAVAVDPERGRAEGWYIDEERRFSLDAERRQIRAGGETHPWDPEEVEIHPDDIYVRTEALGRWFPVDLSVDAGRLRVRVEPREKLPLEERLERRAAWQRLRGSGAVRAGEGREHPFLDLPYRALGWPDLDGAATLSWREDPQGKGSFEARHEAWISGDFLRLSGALFLSASTSRRDTVRFRLGRRSPTPWRLGPLPVTELRIGDIKSPPDSLVKIGRAGRGILISNHPLESAVEFDRTTFQGDTLPGWEVELFHNEILIDFARVGADGRYAFTDVPLLAGPNLFRLVFHGPRGERREQVRRLLIGDGLRRPGESRYRIVAAQQDRGLFDAAAPEVPQAFDTAGREGETGTPRYALSYERGLRGGLTAALGLDSLVLGGERHDYLRLGVLASRGGFFTRLDTVFDRRGGWGARLDGRTRFGRVDLAGRWERFFDFRSERLGSGGDPPASRGTLRIDGAIFRGALPLRYTLSFERERRSGGVAERISGRLAATWRRLSLTQTLSLDRPPEGDATLRGLFLASARLRRFSLRGRVSYSLDPRSEIDSLELTAERGLAGERRLSFGLRRTLKGSDVTRARAGLTWRFQPFDLGMHVDLASDGHLAASASLSYGLRREPGSGRWRMLARRSPSQGSALARVYLDRNRNHRFDESDEPLPGVRLRTNRLGLSPGTDPRGLVFLGELAADRETEVELVASSLEDPHRLPVRQGVAFLPRPGRVPLLDFPVVETGEIDGTVFLQREGKLEAVSGVRLQLIGTDGTVARETRSEYDGFYLFERVLPGSYALRLDPEQSVRLGLVATSEPRLVLGGEEVVLSGVDLELVPRPARLRSTQGNRGSCLSD